jgi:prophage antirepressor-like protein
MANDIQVFQYEGARDMRTFEIEGMPWFVAQDVCAILGLGDTSKAVQSLEAAEKGMSNVPTLGGLQSMTIVNESGMYALIFKSRKIEAKGFRLWVTGTVLPKIRKTGSYALPSSKNVYGILRGLVDDLERQDQQIAAANAKVDQVNLRVDKVIQGIPALPVPETAADEFVTPTVLGKMFNPRQSAIWVNKRLQLAGLQFHSGGEWIPNDKGKDFAKAIPVQLENGKCVYQLHWQRRVFDMICEVTA